MDRSDFLERGELKVDFLKYYRLVSRWACKENDITIYEEILASFSPSNAKIIQGNLYELIYLSSLIVSVFSSTMLDALCFDKPVIRVKFENEFISTLDSSKVIFLSKFITFECSLL